MKVLHVNEYLAQKGGVEAYLRSLLPLLSERGVESHVAYGVGDAEGLAHAHYLPGISTTGFKRQKAIYESTEELLSRIQPDVVNVHNVKNVEVLKACISYGATFFTIHDYRLICPASMFFYKRTKEVCMRKCGPGCFVVTLKKHCLTPRPKHASYFYYRSRWFLDKAKDAVHMITPSKGAKDRLIMAGCDRNRISVVPIFSPVPPAEKTRPVPKQPTITFVGRIAPSKGHEFFVHALGLLPDYVRGVMVGSFTDDSESLVMNLAQKYGCKHKLEIHRWAPRDEVVKILDRTSVFIFPSLWPETLGLVGIEAMARGVPVVASNLGGVSEWLLDGENGVLVQPRSAEQIRDAVLSLIENKDKLFEFGECGRQTVAEKFLPSKHIDKLLGVYEHVDN